MVFSTSIFIYLFLPITLLIYYIAPKKSKNFIILLSGLVFYSWGEPIYVVVMLNNDRLFCGSCDEPL